MLNIISVFGLLFLLSLAWLMSSHRDRIDWRLVTFGIILQFVLAGVFFNSQNWKFSQSYDSFESLLAAAQAEDLYVENIPTLDEDEEAQSFATLLARLEDKDDTFTEKQFARTYWISGTNEVVVPRFRNGFVFSAVESFFGLIQKSVDAGSSFVFDTHAQGEDNTHPKAILTTFAFGVLPTVIFFAALMSVLYYVGFMQRVIRIMAWVMEKTLRTSAAESMAAAANVMVGHTEAPLVVRPYVPHMTRSELNALMVGGFATISGSLMAIFASMGVSAGHLLTASLISAPAALVIAKILQPETETPADLAEAEAKTKQEACNVIEAAANGASEGMKLAINIAAMLIAFLALIMFIDICLQTAAGWIGIELSLSILFGWVFFPLAWIMGIESRDCLVAGDLLGKKLVVNEFLAYIELSNQPVRAAIDGEGISDRTRTILTYALCGFSNFGAIGIQLGGIGPLAGEKNKKQLAQLGLRAMFGGAIAAAMTACIAGIFYGILA